MYKPRCRITSIQRERTVHSEGANQPKGEQARGWTRQEANQPGGEQSRGEREI